MVARGDGKPVYPDMSLWQEIIFLKEWFNGKWVVENVVGYYEPFIKPQEIGKHYFWANFKIASIQKRDRLHNAPIQQLYDRKGLNLSGINVGHRKDQILMNCVEPELSKHIFDCAFKLKQEKII